MALRAGIDLVDMEFVQYYPVVLRWPVTRLLASPTLFPLGARLYNAHGERFMASLPQGTENVTRDIRSRAIFQEIVAGRGLHHDAVIMSLADIDEAAFRRYAPDMAHIVDAQQLDYRTAQFLVRPEAHFLRWCAHRCLGLQRSPVSMPWVRLLGLSRRQSSRQQRLSRVLCVRQAGR